MTIKELMQQLVETDNKDDRMALVENNPELMTDKQPETDTTEIDNLKAENETLRAEVETQKQKYRDRFFSGVKSPDESDTGEDKTEDEEKPKTLDEIYGGKI